MFFASRKGSVELDIEYDQPAREKATLGCGGLLTVLQNGGQGGLVSDVAHPRGQLRVPAQSLGHPKSAFVHIHLEELTLWLGAGEKGPAVTYMATNGFLVLHGPVDKVVSSGKVELATARLRGIPFHRVLRGKLAEIVLDYIGVLGVLQASLIGTGSEVELPLRPDHRIDAASRLSLKEFGRGGQSGQRGQEKDKSGSHAVHVQTGQRAGWSWCHGSGEAEPSASLIVGGPGASPEA